MMTWMTTDGRTVTWEDGLLEGDGFLVDLILGFVRCDALLTQPGGFDMVIASLDGEEQAFNTVTSVLLDEVGLAGLADVPQFGDPNATDGFVFVKPAERPPLEKWLKVMLKGRQRRFASRSEAGRYAAYVRWANNAGVTEIATPEQWKQMNLASGQTPGGESDDPPHIRDAKQAVADLQADLDEFRAKANQLFDGDEVPIDEFIQSPLQFCEQLKSIGVFKDDANPFVRASRFTLQEGEGEIVGKPQIMTKEEFVRFGKYCEKYGIPGMLVGVPDPVNPHMGRVVFIPSPKTVALVQKVQAVGEKIKTAIDIETGQNSPEIQEFFQKFRTRANKFTHPNKATQPSMNDLAKLSAEADKRLAVVSKIVPMGADVAWKSVKSSQEKVFAEATSVAQRFVPKAWGEAISNASLKQGSESSFRASTNEVGLHLEPEYGRTKGTAQTYGRQLGSILRHEMVHAAEHNLRSVGVLSLAFQSMATMGNVPTRAMTDSVHGQNMRSDGSAQSDISLKYATRMYRIAASEMLTTGLDMYLQFQPQFGRVMNPEGIGLQAWSLGMLAVT